jgi:hypothetical protein
MQPHEGDDDSGGDGNILYSLKPDRHPLHGIIAPLPRG